MAESEITLFTYSMRRPEIAREITSCWADRTIEASSKHYSPSFSGRSQAT